MVEADRQRQRDLPSTVPFTHAARLQLDPPVRIGPKRDADFAARSPDDLLGDAPVGLAGTMVGEPLAGLDLAGHRHPHRAQQGTLRIGTGGVLHARQIAPARQDPHGLGKVP